MPQTAAINRRIVLVSRPRGRPTSADFRLEQVPVPTPRDGEVLVRTLYLSLDPYMRNLMDAVGPGYAPPVALGATMVGGTVSVVVASGHASFRVGQRVLANAGWQDYALSDGTDLQLLDDLARPSHALSAFGMPGFTAYIGINDIGQPQAGETVVVAAATGAVGSVVGQLARLRGARVVGIAGGTQKCRLAIERFGFDVCIDRHHGPLAEQLAAACPNGIDVYFENVGGDVLDAVLPLLNVGARVPVCGFISHYNDSTPPARPNRLPALLATVLQKRVRMQGFIILDHYATRHVEFKAAMRDWLTSGRVQVVEDVVDGLDQAPAALMGVLQGRNVGKQLVRVSVD